MNQHDLDKLINTIPKLKHGQGEAFMIDNWNKILRCLKELRHRREAADDLDGCEAFPL